MIGENCHVYRVVQRYAAVATASARQRYVYPKAFIVSVLNQLFVFIVQFSLWRRIFASALMVGGLRWEDTKTYLALTFFINSFIGFQSELAIIKRIADGSVTIDLLKPLDYQGARFAEAMATFFTELIIAIGLVIVIATWTNTDLMPRSSIEGLTVMVSLGLGVLIKFNIVYLAGLACFWTTNGWGVAWAQAALTQLFSGGIAPLSVFPRWFREVSDYLPFKYIIDAPIAIFLGRHSTFGMMQTIAIQLFWAVTLCVIGRRFWHMAIKSLVIHGG